MSRTDLKLAQSAIRCPFCHEDVAIDEPDWVVCCACVARQHALCWEESGACASCGGRAFLGEPKVSSKPGDARVRRIRAEIARVDREWTEQRERLCTRTPQGAPVEPWAGDAVSFAGLGLFGVAAAIVTIHAGAPEPIVLGGIACALCGFCGSIRGAMRASAFKTASVRHLARRDALTSELDATRRGDAA